MRVLPLGAAAAVSAALIGIPLGTAAVAAPATCGDLHASADSYVARSNSTLTQGPNRGILADDCGSPLQIVAHTAPQHGELTLGPNGDFTYMPYRGFTGTDTFTYSVTDSAQLYSSAYLPPLATIGGVAIGSDAYGSSLAPKPGSSDEFYGLTDRGPNVDGPNGTKVEPLPNFDPAIGLFRFRNGTAQLLQTIPLRAKDGTPYTGRVNTDNNTGETITDLNENPLAADVNGYDSEGLVALKDGTFWVSDEYGPFITHFDHRGRAISRLSPTDGSLPRELINRVANKGMEGLAITPDGNTLVGIMQNTLANGISTSNAKKDVVVRIVTDNLKTKETHEYLYVLDSKDTGVSEITALSSTQFLIDERDGDFPSVTGDKKIWKIDLSAARDVGPSSTVNGATYNPNLGLTIGGKTIEQLIDGQDASTAAATLTGLGIAPIAKPATPYVDVDKLLGTLDPTYTFFEHDKVEGLSVLNGGKTVVLSNDSDFGIAGLSNATPPFQLAPKIVPTTGKQDHGEYLVIDTTKAPATSTATVTITVK